jgi:membrane-bound lytic murein transglycosylase D
VRDISKVTGAVRNAKLWLSVTLPMALLLAGCAVRHPAVTEPPPPTEAEVLALAEAEAMVQQERTRIRDSIYSGLEEIALEYQGGVDLIVGGQEVLGEQAQTAALTRLDDLARQCRDLSTCDNARVQYAFQTLLGGQGIALKQQAVQFAALKGSIEEDTEREPGTSPFAAPIPDASQPASLLHGTELRDVITLNGPVNAALDDWLTWMRPLLMKSFENYQFLRADIAPIYEEAGLPEALLFAMMATETGGRVHSFSRAGAAGPMQFMRLTGRRYGLDTVDGFDQRLDPVAAVRANAAYLTEHFALFDGNIEKVLAAYNGGESRMKGLHRRLKGVGFWDSKLYYKLPSETRQYVPRVLAAAWLFTHPEDYNLEFPTLDTRTTSMTLTGDASVGELSVCLGQVNNSRGWFRTIRNLNPRLEPGDRVKSGETVRIPAMLVPVYEQSCGDGALVARARTLHESNYPAGPQMIPYTVRSGDTLGRIASRLRCASLGEIADINRIRAPRYVIRVGQRIKIPTCATR